MTTYSSILAWKIPWTGEPGRLQSMVSKKVEHDRTCVRARVHVCAHTHTLNNSKAQALGTQNCVRHSPHSQEQPASLERHSGLIFLSAPLFYMKSFPQALYPESGNQGFQKVNKHGTHLRILLKYKFWGGALKL